MIIFVKIIFVDFNIRLISILKGLSSFVTFKLKCATGMFAYCRHLKDLDISHFDLSNITTFGGEFTGCSDELQKLEVLFNSLGR